jgi:hypothetical protein
MELLGFAGDAVARSLPRKSVAADGAPKVGDLISFVCSRTRRVGSQVSYGLVQAITPNKKHPGVNRVRTCLQSTT